MALESNCGSPRVWTELNRRIKASAMSQAGAQVHPGVALAVAALDHGGAGRPLTEALEGDLLAAAQDRRHDGERVLHGGVQVAAALGLEGGLDRAPLGELVERCARRSLADGELAADLLAGEGLARQHEESPDAPMDGLKPRP